MASDNLKGMTMNIFMGGFLLLAMISSFVLLANNEGRGEIFDGYEGFEEFNMNLSHSMGADVMTVADQNLNTSLDYDATGSDSGADKQGNAMGANFKDLAVNSFKNISVFFGMIFGNLWTLVISGILSGILILYLGYYLIKWIRTGI